MTESADETTAADGIWARETAPQSDFTSREVGTGLLVLVVGLLVTFGLPLLLG